MTITDGIVCVWSEVTCAYAAGALPANEFVTAEAHIAACLRCQGEVEALRPAIDGLAAWPADILRPGPSLQERLAQRIAGKSGSPPPPHEWREPEWEQVAPGIECKVLARDDPAARVSMLVRLAPGAHYPAHIHAGIEELHLLDGELWIDRRKIVAGEYNFGSPGTRDRRVYSKTGCTCILITSINDILG